MKFLSLSKNSLVILHILSMLFGLFGMVILPRQPEFVARMPEIGLHIYEFGLSKGGALYIVVGALALMIYGAEVLGLRRMWLFFIPACAISLASELLGTSTGFPFGAYEYTELLGYKIAGLVPFAIPLSWFYMGLIAYLLASALFKDVRGLLGTVGPLVLGAWMLTAWDLVLDPAMTLVSPSFWIWKEGGPFFGMPLQNFVGWFGTGLIFMIVARLLWREEPVVTREQLTLPLIIYTANILFAVTLSLGAVADTDLRIPVAMGLLLGQVPAMLCWWFAGLGAKAPMLDPQAE
ncbi:carotenoid biosynthesis protein [Anthocerotibacter panamensis]|uniref:carotenoid biosynthesis protein n=1 Tax=Anthocerotibacter panamensis TaxID=2857077 RepID=UPI001C408119|nr:carotenoid biosynthesis protein [Anthocerotibacter panamensis]